MLSYKRDMQKSLHFGETQFKGYDLYLNIYWNEFTWHEAHPSHWPVCGSLHYTDYEEVHDNKEANQF